MPSYGTHRDIFRYIASGLSAAWAAIGIATAVGAGLAEGPSVSVVSGIVVNMLLLGAAALGIMNARRWHLAILTAAFVVTLQRIGVVVGFGGAAFTVIASALALVAIVGSTLVAVAPARR